MEQTTEPALDPPPRKAQLRRGTRNLRRAYRTLGALIVLVFGGWALLDGLHWNGLSEGQRILTIGFGLGALLAFVILCVIEHPLRRELRLARIGYVARGQITSIGSPRGRRRLIAITYCFQTVAGLQLEGRCVLPRRFPVASLSQHQSIDVLYDPANPSLNRPRLALDHVEFGSPDKAKGR